MDLHELLREAVERKASDICIVVGIPPALRINGRIVHTNRAKLMPEDTKALIYSILTDDQKWRFAEQKELDFGYGVPGLGRFRMNVHFQRGSVAAAIRVIADKSPNINELGLPPSVLSLYKKNKGLILVTGPTGSGKSTTLAGIIEQINSEKACHIISIEDPIEYLYRHNKSIIEQREVHIDAQSFQSALKYVLRQDPDVILIGEMRDLETISIAMTAAETGHMVLATLHTNSAAQTVNRIVDVFPASQQQQVKTQFASVIEAVISQQLIPLSDGSGRVLACEVMLGTPAVRNLIREGDITQLQSVMEMGAESGMQTMNQSLRELYLKNYITFEEALAHSSDPKSLSRMILKM